MQTTSYSTRPKFKSTQGSTFFNTLRQRVDQYFVDSNINKHANATMIWKTIILLTSYIVLFFFLSNESPVYLNMIIWTIMGVAVAGIGMSVMHDANHGAYSSNPTVNYIVGHSLNLLGGSVLNWKLQHNILHHTYTNVTYFDDDIADKLVLKFSPHTKVKKFHQFQILYLFFFYGIITLYWVVLKDFIQYHQYIKRGVNSQTPKENIIFLIKIILIKVAYLLVILGVPIWYWNLPVLEVIGGFLLMHFVAGIILSTIFQLAHTVEETTHPMPDDKGIIHNEWAIHQLETTVNFAKNNKWLSWYIGGLNYQIEHHLFPKISHVHYPAISKIVKATALEHGIPYHENETFMEALRSHLNYLRQIGRIPSLNELID